MPHHVDDEHTLGLTEDERRSHKQVIPGVTPAAVLDAMEDPESFAEVARGDLYVQMAVMRRHAASPEFPTGQRIEYMKFLSRMGKVAEPERAGGELANLPGISIILPNSGGRVSIESSHARQEKEVSEPAAIDAGFGHGGGKPSKAEIP